MQNDKQPLGNEQPITGTTPPPASPTGRKVIQPSAQLVQELQAQAQSAPLTASTPQVTPAVPQSVYPQPDKLAAGGFSSASARPAARGLVTANGSATKSVFIKAGFGLVVLGAIFALLVFTNVIALSRFKTVSYVTSKGSQLQLSFYTKHSAKRLPSGNTQLVSKVSNDDKFPVTLSVADSNEAGYDRVKNCSGLSKMFDVQNDTLHQTIAVCDFGKQGTVPGGAVYVAGFTQNDQAYLITIGQNYAGADLSSQSGAQQTLTRFGLDAYQDDIETMLGSIQVD